MSQTKHSPRQQPQFELIAGNVCLDFINTLDDRSSGAPKELLKGYGDLVRFGEQAGILTSRQANDLHHQIGQSPKDAGKAINQARILREALHDIFLALTSRKSVPQPAMQILNDGLHDAFLHSHLVLHHNRCEWRFDELTTSFNGILWPIARAAGDLLVSADAALVGMCSSPTCQWFFLDTSKNHRRRWCDMKLCGNRAKARRFYTKRQRAVG